MTQPPDHPEGAVPNRSLTVRQKKQKSLQRPRPVDRSTTAASDEDGHGGITPFFLWCVFTRWWKVVLPVSIVCAVIACAAVLYCHVLKYRATAIMMIEGSTPYIAFNAPANAGAQNQFVQTQIELLRSPMVLEKTLAHPKVGSLPEFQASADPVENLKGQLSIKQIARSELYEIAFVSPSRQGASDVVNAVVEEYSAIRSKEDSLRSDRVIELLQRQSDLRKVEVARLRSELVELTKKITGTDPFSQNIMTDPEKAGNPATALFQDLTNVEVDRELLKAELQSVEESADEPIAEAAPSEDVEAEVDSMPQVRDLQKQIDLVRSEMEEIKKRAVAQEKHPEYVSREKDVATLEEELKDLRIIFIKQIRRNQSPLGGLKATIRLPV